MEKTNPRFDAESANLQKIPAIQSIKNVEGYRVLDGGVLTALDGVWYHASENIRCGRCLHTTKDEVTTYYHAAPAGAIVKPGDTSVLPVMAEMIANGDGEKKQDCELTAAKRWMKSHGQEYAWLKPTFLGDDLYSREPFCRRLILMRLPWESGRGFGRRGEGQAARNPNNSSPFPPNKCAP